jgi:hypothetical protein
VTFPHPDCIWIYGNKDDDEAKRRIGRIWRRWEDICSQMKWMALYGLDSSGSG